MRFKNQSVIVTGGGSGIGRATALKFAQEGARVAVFDLNEEAAVRTVQEIRSFGSKAIAFRVDVSDEEQVKTAIEKVIDTFGTIHVLINNAGMIMPKTVEDTTPEEWDRIFHVNTKSVYLNCKYALPELKKNKGKIVSMASMTGIMGQQGNTPYSATKGAIIAMTKSMAIDYAPLGVRINCVCPAGVATPLLESWFETMEDPNKAREDQDKSHMLGYTAIPDEIANTIVFLASDDSSFVTGQAIQIEGGATLGYGKGPKVEWDTLK